MELKYKIKNCVYLLEIIFLFIFQNISLFSLEISGVKPIMLIPAYVSMSMFMSKKEAAIYGIITGLFLDMEISSVLGIHILLLFLFGCFIGFLSEHIIKTSMINTIIISLFMTLIIGFIRFLLFYVLRGYGDNLYALSGHYLPGMMYTVVITPVFYLFNRGITYFTVGKEGV